MSQTLTLDESLLEAYGRFVDPREPYYDTPGMGWLSRKMGFYTTIDRRLEGRYAPIYENELDLKAIRMAAWLMDAEVPVAKAMKARLRDYTIASGFDWEIKHNSPRVQDFLTRMVDRFFLACNWMEIESESFEREIVDGEFCALLQMSEGDVGIEVLESDALTEPALARDLEEWQGFDFPCCWTFGVLTRENRAKPIGYHIVRDAAGADWDYVPECEFIHWKRNVPVNAKRGASDHFTTHKWLNYGEKVLTRTAQGAAIQASIAYIVEHAAGVTGDQAAAMAARRSRVETVRRDVVGGGSESVRKRDIPAGQVIDIKHGQKYHASMLGANSTTIYIDTMEALFRLSGTIYAFPEHMLTGYAGNNNRASSETAESPFIQGRYHDQRTRGERLRRLIVKIIRLCAKVNPHLKMDADEVLQGLEVSVASPDIVNRDTGKITEALIKQAEQGWVSKRMAIQELGRDFDDVTSQLETEAEEAAEAKRKSDAEAAAAAERAGFQGENLRPGGAPGGNVATNPAQAGQPALPGVGAAAESGEALAESVAAAGAAEALVVADDYALDGYGRWLEGFDPYKHPRGKDGKFISAGVSFPGAMHNSAAQWATKKINKLEKLVADGNWAKFQESLYVPKNKPGTSLNKYQKGLLQAQTNLSNLKDKAVTSKVKNANVQDDGSSKGWKKIGPKLGTEVGGTYTGPDGKKYYVKTPADENRARNEVLSLKLYELAGAQAVKGELVDIDGKKAVATEWIDTSKKAVYNNVEKAEAAKDFAVHAWLANWDAVGAGTENPMDNIRNVNGKMVLVDAGGSLLYKGMGGSGKKYDVMPYEAKEWMTLRQASVNPSMAKVFSDMTPHQLAATAKKLSNVSDESIKSLVDKYYQGTDSSKGLLVDSLTQRRDYIVAKGKQMEKMVSKATPASDQQAKMDALSGVLGNDPGLPLGDKKPAATPSAAALATAAAAKDAAAAADQKAKMDALSGALGNAPKPNQAAQVAAVLDAGGGALPAPPHIPESNKSYLKTIGKLTAAAEAGDVAALQAIKTNATSQSTYTKKTHEYKVQLLAAVAGGKITDGKPTALAGAKVKPKAATTKKPTPTPKPKTAKLNDDELGELTVPAFVTSNTAQAAANQATLDSLKSAALAGNLSAVEKEASSHPSPKIKAYAAQVAATMKSKQEGSLAAVSYTKIDLKSIGSQIPTKATEATDRVGYWAIMGSTPGVETANKGVWKSSFLTTKTNLDLMAKGEASIDKMSTVRRNAVKFYTGAGSKPINKSMRAAKGDKKKWSAMAKRASGAVDAHSIPLNEGMTLGRRYDGFKDISKLKVGQVIADDGLLSTSTSPGAWSGDVHIQMKVGPGVKGLPVQTLSSYASEQEVILPAGTRVVIRQIVMYDPDRHKSTDMATIYAEILPN